MTMEVGMATVVATQNTAFTNGLPFNNSVVNHGIPPTPSPTPPLQQYQSVICHASSQGEIRMVMPVEPLGLRRSLDESSDDIPPLIDLCDDEEFVDLSLDDDFETELSGYANRSEESSASGSQTICETETAQVPESVNESGKNCSLDKDKPKVDYRLKELVIKLDRLPKKVFETNYVIVKDNDKIQYPEPTSSRASSETGSTDSRDEDDITTEPPTTCSSSGDEAEAPYQIIYPHMYAQNPPPKYLNHGSLPFTLSQRNNRINHPVAAGFFLHMNRYTPDNPRHSKPAKMFLEPGVKPSCEPQVHPFYLSEKVVTQSTKSVTNVVPPAPPIRRPRPPTTVLLKPMPPKNGMGIPVRRRRRFANAGPSRCQFCDKIFTNNQTLHNHLLMHTGERPYSCPICAAGYIQKSHLVGHLARHHTYGYIPEVKKNLKYSCAFCEKRFPKSLPSLVYHIRDGHKDKLTKNGNKRKRLVNC